MAMSPELMKLVAGGAGKGATGPTPQAAAAGANTPPTGSPMSAPQEQEGMQQKARVNINMALDLLEQAIPAFGSETEEGKSLLSALSTLGKKFGQKREGAGELVPAQIRQLLASLPQALGASPEMKALQQPPAAGGGAPPPPMPAAA